MIRHVVRISYAQLEKYSVEISLLRYMFAVDGSRDSNLVLKMAGWLVTCNRLLIPVNTECTWVDLPIKAIKNLDSTQNLRLPTSWCVKSSSQGSNVKGPILRDGFSKSLLLLLSGLQPP